MNRHVLSFSVISGVIAPILISIVLIVIGFFHPNYNHFTQYMSELGAIEAPYGLILNTIGFPLLGMLIIFFAFALDIVIEKGRSYWDILGPILLVISGVSFIFVSIFPCDPGCKTISIIGVFHGIMAFIALFSLVFSPLFMNYRLSHDNKWCNYDYFSLGVFIFAFIISFIYYLNIFEDFVGLFQRLSFGVPLFWVEIIGIKLFLIFRKKI
jgi:hypothetical membrane protein